MPDRLPEINLLPEFRHESRTQSILFLIFVALVLIAFAFMGYLYFSTKSKLATTTSEVSELTEQRDLLTAQKNQLEADETSAYEDAVHFVENYAIPTSVIVTELNRLLPEEGFLSEYDYNSSGVKVVSHFETLDDVAGYTTKLINSEYFTDTKVESIETFALKEEEGDDGQVLFNVIPRYESDFSLLINKHKIKEESLRDE